MSTIQLRKSYHQVCGDLDEVKKAIQETKEQVDEQRDKRQ